MNKCLKITLTVEVKEGFLQNVIQQQARNNGLEGMVQPLGNGKVKIIVCGKKDKVDSFVDSIHRESTQTAISDIEIEPHVRDKDYRGVFRVIE